MKALCPYYHNYCPTSAMRCFSEMYIHCNLLKQAQDRCYEERKNLGNATRTELTLDIMANTQTTMSACFPHKLGNEPMSENKLRQMRLAGL